MSKRKSRTASPAALPADLDGPPAGKGYDGLLGLCRWAGGPYDMRDGLPFCLRCNRPVDGFGMKWPMEKIHGWHGSTEFHTGEAIITIRCHGETWVMSNWRGVISHGEA